MSSNPPRFTQDYIVNTPKEQNAYFIPERDLKRLEDHIRRIVSPTRYFQILGTFFLSVFVSGVFAALGFRIANGLPGWLLPTTWAIVVGALVLGISLLLLDARDKRVVTSSIDSALGELQGIKENCSSSHREIEGQMSEAPPDLRITRAFYGAGDLTRDVTRHLQAELDANGRLQLLVNNDQFGFDPAEGKHKKLYLDYAYRGQESSIEVDEDQSLILPPEIIDKPRGSKQLGP